MDLAQAQAALEKTPFTHCSASQEKSSGWIAPRGQEHGALIESIQGQWMLRFVTESKILPASVIQSRVEEKVQAIEAESGRKPGKKERQDIKDEAKLDLLPMAFTKMQGTWVWIDRKNHWLVLDASAQGRADEIITALVDAFPGFIPRLVQTNTAPDTAMAQWLSDQEGPSGFKLGDECELKSSDDTRSVVRYARHALEIEEIKQHITNGKRPTRVALNWGDRVFFVLTQAFQIKKLSFADVVFEDKSADDGNFDADVALTTGELTLLIPELIAALDGEMDLSQTGTPLNTSPSVNETPTEHSPNTTQNTDAATQTSKDVPW